MVTVQACQLSLPNPSFSFLAQYSPPPHITSFLFDSNSNSLALHHSDTSLSLYPSLSPLSLSSFPSPSTLVPSPTSSAAFLHLLSNPNPRSIFITSSPFLGGTAVLFRFFIFHPTRKAFVKLKVRSNHTDLRFDDNKYGVVFAVSHGVSVKLAGGSNFFTMYSVSNSKIWVFAVKLEADFEEVKLMKCAVIDCVLPVFSMSVSSGHLILGEENGVRFFPLRPLVKGRVNREGRVSSSIIRRNLNGGMDNKDAGKLEVSKANKLQNGLVQGINGIDHAVHSSNSGRKNMGPEGAVSVVSNGQFEGKMDKRSESVKPRTMTLRQDTRDWGVCFIAFNGKQIESFRYVKMPVKSPKAISIHVLSLTKFLILDSDGDLHLMCLSNSVHGSECPFHTTQLTQTARVHKLAVLPGSQIIWISDGQYTVQMIVLTDEETSMSGTLGKESTQAIFVSEKIQEIIPLSANAILVLGQGGFVSKPLVIQKWMVNWCLLSFVGVDFKLQSSQYVMEYITTRTMISINFIHFMQSFCVSLRM
ncbi:uncharacterized protein LOC113776691 isoform X3 [Coffea eugenioides]|uniref:uncharacterized protein LOC113776691 isoform X3 n=1 Tax=Coffea eugenioides TaxID=49369 RepID=UPI000F606349|nr:uncharacterized protein LOC113776691 isoform X3 [Coffea eugenioides]